MVDPQQAIPPAGDRVSPAVTAWVAARTQRNRLIVLLSAAGIGLLVTLLVALGPVSQLELILFAAGGGGFFVALVAGLLGFERAARVDSLEPLVSRLDS